MDRIAEVCLACEHRGDDLFCKTLKISVNCLISCATPFCPLGKHKGLGRSVVRSAPAKIATAGTNGRGVPIARKRTKPVPQSRWCRFRGCVVGYVAAPLKLGLVVLGAYRPADKIVKRRRVICLGDGKDKSPCEHRQCLVGVVERCRACGCSITAKTALAPEACPEMKWPSVRPEDCGCGG